MTMDDPVFRAARALEGQVLQGHYRVERLVGKGGMAWVYRAFHQQLQEPVAIKVLKPDLSGDSEIRERFLSEARVQFRMQHPHIVRVTEVVDDPPWNGMVMEWIEGENLKQLLKRVGVPLSRKDIWRIMAPVLDAVGFAHHKGLVHRDIKPANLLLQKQGGEVIPKVADFGIAKFVDEIQHDLTSTGMTMGTLKYMAPEQIRDSKHVDHRADIYSLGVTLYLMATQQPPFRGQQDWIIYQQLHEPPAPPSEHNPRLTASFDEVVLRCLAKEPDERFASCHELLHALSLSLLPPSHGSHSPDDLNLFEISHLIDALPSSDSLYDSSIHPVPDSVLQPMARGVRATPFLQGTGSGRPQATDATRSSSTALNPTASGEPPRVWVEPSASEDATALETPPSALNEEASAALPTAVPFASPDSVAPDATALSSSNQGPGFAQEVGADATQAESAWDVGQRMEPGESEPASHVQAAHGSGASVAPRRVRRRWGGVVVLLLAMGLGAGGVWWFASPGSVPASSTPRQAPVFRRVATPSPALDKNDRSRSPRRKPARRRVALVGCTDGERRPCYTGPAATQGKGRCRGGHRICRDGRFGPCQGEVTPAQERCNGRDDDCDGRVDESLSRVGQRCTLRRNDCSLPGTFRCNAKRGRLVCQPARGAGRFPVLRVTPRRRFRLRYRGRVRWIRGRFCLGVKRRTTVRVSAKGYVSCLFAVTPGRKVWRVRMKRRDPGGLEPLERYCVKP